MQIRLDKNTITPDLRKKLSRMANPRPVMQAIGLALVALTTNAFKESALRPSSWKPKKDGSPATLRKSGALWQSIRITKLEAKSVTVGSDRRTKKGNYSLAAIHQLGSEKRNIPARPFFPFTANGKPTPEAQRRILAAAKKKLDTLLKK